MQLETWGMLSYIITVVGLPLAIFVFLVEQRKVRYQLPSDDDQDILQVEPDHPDLRLLAMQVKAILNDEQKGRRYIAFAMLASLFERTCRLLCEDDMASKQARRRNSWKDDRHKGWVRPEFCASLPRLLRGEDQGSMDNMTLNAADKTT